MRRRRRRSTGPGSWHPLLRHGAALRPWPFRATSRCGSCRASARQYVVSTKVGRLLEPVTPPRRARRRGLRRSGNAAAHLGFQPGRRAPLAREQSRPAWARSRRHRVPHDPDDHWDEAYGDAYPALEELRAQGVVSAIGAGMNQTRMLRRVRPHTDMDLLMLAGRYTLLEQAALDELLPAVRRAGRGGRRCRRLQQWAAPRVPFRLTGRSTTTGRRRRRWWSEPAGMAEICPSGRIVASFRRDRLSASRHPRRRQRLRRRARSPDQDRTERRALSQRSRQTVCGLS